ncbi:hypothetical protein IFR05_015824 [Cadophora sp. M221]|nr:hypothetical protein IFR05_015824 [Cadophora sp. M221]
MIAIEVKNYNDIDEFGDAKKQIFTIHHNILAHYSLYFRSALNASPKRTSITIQGCESAFGLLQNWFYTQKIEGPTGEIKLAEYVKLWKLAKDLVVVDLEPLVLKFMEITKPGRDDEKGNMLKDFQSFAYMGTQRGLEDMAIKYRSRQLSSENESVEYWGREGVLKTGYFGKTEANPFFGTLNTIPSSVVEGTPELMENEHPKEVDDEMERMIMYDEESDDEEESNDETEQEEN